MARLPWSYLLAAASLLTLGFVLLRDSFDSAAVHHAVWAPGSVGHQDSRLYAAVAAPVADSVLQHGQVIMPKLPNATAKAELGRASWKLLHTMAARFPEQPTADERAAFQTWLYLFARLYPCGECAAEFQQLLQGHPPQTSSRGAASLYLCHLHNLVNERLGKPEYDCGTNLRDVYDCGCGEEEEKERARAARPETDSLRAEAKREEMVDAEAEDDVRRDPVTGMELRGG